MSERRSHSGGASEEKAGLGCSGRLVSDGRLEGEGELRAHASLVQDHLLIQAHFLLLLLLQLPPGVVDSPTFFHHGQPLFRQFSLRLLQVLAFLCQSLLKLLEAFSLVLLRKPQQNTVNSPTPTATELPCGPNRSCTLKTCQRLNIRSARANKVRCSQSF